VSKCVCVSRDNSSDSHSIRRLFRMRENLFSLVCVMMMNQLRSLGVCVCVRERENIYTCDSCREGSWSTPGGHPGWIHDMFSTVIVIKTSLR